VLITGAGGFIGRALCAALAGEGAAVRGADIATGARSAVEATGAGFVVADVTNPEQLAAAIADTELVLHTAAFIHEGGEMDEFVALNVRGTAGVLEAAERAGARVVHLSSVVVYGYESPATLDEEATLRFTGIPYIDTKAASDRLARRRGAVVVRPGDVYGPASVPWTLRPLELARRGRLAVPAPGDGRMLPVHVDDLVEATLLAALAGEGGRAYTVWSGEEVTFRDYFSRLAGLVGGQCRVLPRTVLALGASALALGARLRGEAPAMSPRAITFLERRGSVSNRRAREELGWEPRVTLAEGLRGIEERIGASGGPHA
jgi:nucleoside-diphosphate-sugar epimerase